MNLAHLADYNARQFGEYTFLTFNDRDYSNLEVSRLSNRLANGLRVLGVARGDRVVVLMPNSPDVIISFQAIFKAGAVVVPLLFLLGAREVRYILQDSGATTVITSQKFVDKVREAADGLAGVKKILVAEDDLPKIYSQGSAQFAMVDTSRDDVAVMIYTAGTTGKPKGVMLTHYNLYANAKLAYTTLEFSNDEETPASQTDISLLVLPLAHSYGLTVMNAGYISGARYVIMPFFEPEQAMALIQKYRVTAFSGVPTMFVYMLNHPKFSQFDLSSVRSWGSGSAPLPIEIQKKFDEKIGQLISEGYGLSEYSPVVSTQRRNRERRMGSVGLPLFGTEVRIVDDEDRVLGVNEPGELIVRGPCMMKGYHKLPERTAQVLRNGWLHTGDIARIDKDGYIYILERKDDMIIRGGENIYPREVEEILYRHPAVAEASVIGVPDVEQGQVVRAFVVLKQGQIASEEDLIAHCEVSIAKFKAPKAIQFLEAMPKNQMGKILRKELRTMAAPTPSLPLTRGG